jgi:RluA family pseudouridine synthase
VHPTRSIVEENLLYEDNHLLVVNKPAGMLTQGDATGDLDLLTAAKLYLKEKHDKPGNVFLGLVHRLDRPVSGAMVFARTSKAASRLSRQFRKRTVEKRYLAIVEGKLDGNGVLVDYLRKDHRIVRIVDAQHPQGARAELSYETLAQENQTSLVEVQLATGRPHQIRVQLANLGHPVVGDFRYGARTELDGRNLALHSYRLQIEHPTKGEPMTWQVEPPPTWAPRYRNTIRTLLAR